MEGGGQGRSLALPAFFSTEGSSHHDYRNLPEMQPRDGLPIKAELKPLPEMLAFLTVFLNEVYTVLTPPLGSAIFQYDVTSNAYGESDK